jgi:hypothetical protein
MGADFKEKSRKTFEKCWDRAAVAANTPDLFRKVPERAAKRFEAEAIGDASIQVGESVLVRLEGGALVGRRGVSPVLTIAQPSVCLLRSIAEGCNVARADVVAADPISGVFEITLN